jgi:hypothetical protein
MMIKIGHLNKADVLAVLFNNAKTQGMGQLRYKAEHVMDREEAQALLSNYAYFDYLEGRVLKVDLVENEFDPWLYDRDNGAGAAARVIEELEEKLTKPE